MDIKTLVLSASSLKTYKQCGKKFNLQKILKAKPTDLPYHYGWAGTITHNTIYYAFADFEGGVWIPRKSVRTIEEVKEFFIDVWDGVGKLKISKELNELGELSLDWPVFKSGSVKRTSYDKLAYNESNKNKLRYWDLVKTGYDFIESVVMKSVENPKTDILLEQELTFELDEGYNIIGYIDVMLNIKGKWIFLDFKTTKTPPKDLDTDIQFYLYRYGLKKKLNLDYYPTGFYIHLGTAKAIPAKNTEEAVLNSAHTNILKLIHGIEAEHFPENRDFLCEFCEFRSHCYGGKSLVFTTDKKLDYLEDSLNLITGDNIIPIDSLARGE